MSKKFKWLSFSFLVLIEISQSQTMYQLEGNNVHSDRQNLSEQLDNYMQALTKLNRFSGSVVVAKGDKILLNNSYGLASHEFEIPNTPETKFRICSIIKMIIAVAILQLQEKGLLDVNDSISTYFDDFGRGNDITIHQLLTHTSGLSSENLPWEMVSLPTSLEDLCSFVKNQPLEFEPGSSYKYSNSGYYILSLIIKKISGESLEYYIKKNILLPLNMKKSFSRVNEYEILKNCAFGYCFNNENEIVTGHFIYENNSNLFCTAYDLYLFAKALIDGKLINEESRELMFSIYNNKENYGYGCSINDLFGNKLIEHGGMLSSGFKSNLSIFIEDDIYIIILSNLFSSWVNEARDGVAAILFNKPYDFPSTKIIEVDLDILNEYAGVYKHPIFKNGYEIQLNGNILYSADGKELSPIAKDQFMTLNCGSDNMLYIFSRNENGAVDNLKIKGGAPYFAIVCEKI